MKKNLLIAPLTLLLALVLGSCSGEKEKVNPDDKAGRAKTTNAKGARTVNNISFGFSSVPSNGRFNFPYNAACNCYKGQVTVYAYNGTGGDVYSPNFVVGRVYTTSPITTYSVPADNTGNQRTFVIESIDAVSNGSVTRSGMGSYAFRWYPSDLAGEFWPYGTSSSVTFTVKSVTSSSEATWGVFPQSPFTTSTLVYGDDNVTFAKQF